MKTSHGNFHIIRNFLGALIIAGTFGLVGCNSGGSSGTPAAANPYAITNYNLTPNSQTNCALNGSSLISCTANSVIAAVYTVTFVEPTSGVGAYVQIPLPSGTNTFGVTVASNGCDQSPAAAGATYTCSFNLSGNNAQSGNSFYIPITGSLGSYNLIQVQLN